MLTPKVLDIPIKTASYTLANTTLADVLPAVRCMLLPLEEFVRQIVSSVMLPVLTPKTTYPLVSPTSVLELVNTDRRPTQRAVPMTTLGLPHTVKASSNLPWEENTDHERRYRRAYMV